MTRLRKQFSELGALPASAFKVIELKDFCIKRGIIARTGESGSLENLLKKLFGIYMNKDDNVRKSEDWEHTSIREDLRDYAAKDVYVSKLIYSEAAKRVPLALVDSNTPAGTRVLVAVQEDGQTVARGRVSAMQPKIFEGIRLAVPSHNRILIDIEEIVVPSASAILHVAPGCHADKTQAGVYTFGQLDDIAKSKNSPLRVVTFINHLKHDPGDDSFTTGDRNLVRVQFTLHHCAKADPTFRVNIQSRTLSIHSAAVRRAQIAVVHFQAATTWYLAGHRLTI